MVSRILCNYLVINVSAFFLDQIFDDTNGKYVQQHKIFNRLSQIEIGGAPLFPQRQIILYSLRLLIYLWYKWFKIDEIC